ncbi:flagellar basal-body rod modification protein FlgD [Candidatus Magnetomorum sp. HK-1]|nr:flagellar basal-body rod modification protein FlgD [Candidatus Magnetomorum sp. HK-1]
MSISEVIANNRNIDTTPKTEAEKAAEMNKEQFLTLLVAQLQNQDPLNPMESTEFTSQLAQFSSLEQMIDVNKNLLDIKTAVSGEEKGDPISYIGKLVKADDNTIIIEDGNTVSGQFSIKEAANIDIAIYNQYGKEIRTMHAGWFEPGEYPVEWAGKDNLGFDVSDGEYTFEVFGQNQFGNYVSIDTFSTGEVTGLTHAFGAPYLLLGDKKVALSNVIEVKNINNNLTENLQNTITDFNNE